MADSSASGGGSGGETAAAPAAPAQASPKKSKAGGAAKKPRTKPAHGLKCPRTSEMVWNAIKSLEERGGSSLQAIKKYIAANYKVNSEKHAPFIKKYLKTAVASGDLVQTKGKGASGSFKLPAAASAKPEKAGGKTAKTAKRKEGSLKMQVNEPQFQRDLISLLPKELALYVLSFLEPRDLLRAAQTCRNWRFLAEDNFLWREKCREAGIEDVRDNRRRPRIASPWKAAFMRQHTIEMNWRTQPLRPPKVLKSHDLFINCLQLSGNRIVSGSDDNTLKVWSATTGKCLRTLVGHTGAVWSCQMSGTIIISGSADRTLKVWNADSGHCIYTLCGHTSEVVCMHLHGKKVVSGSADATLRVWNIDSGECLHVLIGHLATVRCVQYDGRLVVSGAYDTMVKVWNPDTEECLHTLQGHTRRIISLQFDGIHVVSCSLDFSIRVWDVETGACRHTLLPHYYRSRMKLRNNILVSVNVDCTVKVWDIVTGQCLKTLSGPNKHHQYVTCAQFNNKFVIISSDDGTVKLWDVRTGDFIRNLVVLEGGRYVQRLRANETKLVCAIARRYEAEATKLLVLDFDVDGK